MKTTKNIKKIVVVANSDTTQAQNKSVYVNDYTQHDLDTNNNVNVLTNYISRYKKLFDAIRSTKEELSNLDDFDLVARAFKNTYALENTEEEIAFMLTREYNTRNNAQERVNATKTTTQEVAKTDTKVVIQEEVMNSIAKHRKDKSLEQIQLIMLQLVTEKKLSLNASDVIAHIYEQKQREKKTTKEEVVLSF